MFTVIGIDQRPEEKHVFILRISSDLRIYIAHAEVVNSSLDFNESKVLEYCIALAKRWGVESGVVDGEPDFSFATGFGSAFPKGMIWLADYAESDHAIRWSDSTDQEAVKKTAREASYPWFVKLDRYKHLLFSLNLIKNGRVKIPKDVYSSKVQDIRINGKLTPKAVGAEFQTHFENIAKRTIAITDKDPNTKEILNQGREKSVFHHLAIEPHFVHAYAYAIAALMRRIPENELWTPARETPAHDPSYTGQIMKTHAVPKKKMCAHCKYFELNPRDANGWGFCSNEFVAKKQGTTPPLSTRPSLQNCDFFEVTKN
jgi:hypothetical protein